jgi:phosphate starvation-inducible protein PhoH and related proteins
MPQGENNLSKAKRRIYNNQENVIEFDQNRKQNPRNIELRPKTRNQEQLVLNLLDPGQHIVMASGPAGTGKTYLAMLAAIKALRSGQCERIVLTRPAVGVEDERHGFLPGDLISKMEPWTRPLLDVLREYYSPRDIAAMMEEQIIEISPLAYMRGRTFRNAWIVADEMQNATPGQMKMLLSRIGENSKIVVTGDIEQADRSGKDNGLLDVVQRLESRGGDGIAVCNLGKRDIQRHPIIDTVLSLYAD